jgi:hypothetical protein
MKRAFLLIVVPALLVALGFAQTPTASGNTEKTNIKGCLGGAEGNYTVVESNSGHIFKITASSVDLKAHLGHDVTVIGHRAGGMSSADAENGFTVTELNMISEHCVAAVTAPVASISTLAETAITPAVAVTAPAASISTPAETAVTPAVAVAAPAATISTPAETAVTPAVAAAPPTTTVTTPAEPAVKPAATAAPQTRMPVSPRKLPATPAAAAATPAATASTSPEPVSTPAAAATTPAATASTSAEPASTPEAAAPIPTAPARRGSLWLLIAFVVLVIAIGTMVPSLSRWRKRKNLERTGTQNLSFTPDASSDPGKSDKPVERKAA